MDWMSVSILFISFAVLLGIGVPVTFSIGLSALLTLLASQEFGQATFIIAQRLAAGMDSFALLAIPFFILAGNIMNRGGLALRLVNFAKVLGGFLPGALAQCTILANMLFGALSGSAVAAGAAIGGVMTPLMKKEGYDPAFGAAVNIVSCPTGLLIPPSNAFIVFSLISGGTSVAALFLAGILPGLLMGVGAMIVAYVIAKKRKYPTSRPESFSQALGVTWRAIPALGLIIVIMGGILSGKFTPTEASAIAVMYSLILSLLYRELKVAELPAILLDSALTSAVVLILIGASSGMSFAMTNADIPYMISEALLSISENKIIILLIVNLMLLIVGTFMDMTPALLIFVPILLPIMDSLGVDRVHFGVFLVFNLCIGIITPPVGSALFIGCSVAGISIDKVLKTLIPFFIMIFVVLMLVTYIPDISLILPKMFLNYMPSN